MTGLSFDEVDSNGSEVEEEEDVQGVDSTVAVDSLIILHPTWLTRMLGIATNKDCIKAFLDKRSTCI